MFDSVIDPTLGPARNAERAPTALADRPESLSGLRLGLLANIKRNAEPFLAAVGQVLVERHGVAEVLARKKPDITNTAP
jgi:hypothetical protein